MKYETMVILCLFIHFKNNIQTPIVNHFLGFVLEYGNYRVNMSIVKAK